MGFHGDGIIEIESSETPKESFRILSKFLGDAWEILEGIPGILSNLNHSIFYQPPSPTP